MLKIGTYFPTSGTHTVIRSVYEDITPVISLSTLELKDMKKQFRGSLHLAETTPLLQFTNADYKIKTVLQEMSFFYNYFVAGNFATMKSAAGRQPLSRKVTKVAMTTFDECVQVFVRHYGEQNLIL